LAGEEPVLTLHGMSVFAVLVWFFGAGTFSTAATSRLLSGLAVLRPRLVGSPRPPMKVSSASRKPRSGRAGSSLSPWRSLCVMVQAVWPCITTVVDDGVVGLEDPVGQPV